MCAGPEGVLRLGEESLAVENRLTAEQIAALAPGDVVTIESGQEFSWRRHVTATVARVDASCITVRCEGPRGGKFVERYGLRDGLRVGHGNRAELVNAQPDPVGDEKRLQIQRMDALFRAWNRDRRDVETLRELHAAIGDRLHESPPRSSRRRVTTRLRPAIATPICTGFLGACG